MDVTISGTVKHHESMLNKWKTPTTHILKNNISAKNNELATEDDCTLNQQLYEFQVYVLTHNTNVFSWI